MGLRVVVEILRLAILHVGMDLKWRIISNIAAHDAGFFSLGFLAVAVTASFPWVGGGLGNGGMVLWCNNSTHWHR